MKTPKRKTRARSPKRKPRQTARAAHDVDLDAEVHHMVDDLAPALQQLRAAQEEARAQGLFPGDRELLMCPKCGLTEDVLANGQLVTSHGADEPDTGLRFIEPKSIDEPFLCPECDGEAREVPVWTDEEPEPPWEGATSLRVERANVDAAKVERLCAALCASERVRPSVRKKSNDELLSHYGLAAGDLLTNLGVLLVGHVRDRARLGGVCSVTRRHLERRLRLPRRLRGPRRDGSHHRARV